MFQNHQICSNEVGRVSAFFFSPKLTATSETEDIFLGKIIDSIATYVLMSLCVYSE